MLNHLPPLGPKELFFALRSELLGVRQQSLSAGRQKARMLYNFLPRGSFIFFLCKDCLASSVPGHTERLKPKTVDNQASYRLA
jgi:uncharacterized membrane protein